MRSAERVRPEPGFAAVRGALEAGETSCEALVEAALARIEAENPRLNAFLWVDAEGARAAARALDAAPGPLPLRGLLLGVKDNLAVRDQPLTCGSRMLRDFRSLYTATAVERLRAAGALVLGKLNCDEFAMGSSNETSHFGPVRHPADPERVPGGSSGGSAAAVAAGLCHAALGSDTGGSIRQPAAFCGVVGLKPTYGRVSRYGLVAHASSLDTVGPLAPTVADAAAVLQAMAGPDPHDATSAAVPVDDYVAGLGGNPAAVVRGLRVGLPDEYFGEGLDPAVRAAVEERAEALRAAGAEVRRVRLPHTPYGIATYYVIATAEASSNLARYDGVRFGHRADARAVEAELAAEREALRAAAEAAERAGDAEGAAEARRALARQEGLLERLYARTRAEGFGAEVRRRILLGTYVLSAGYYDAYYAQAQRVRTLIRRDFERAFAEVDLLLAPATPAPAFRLGEKTADPLQMYLSDVHTVPASLAGLPALAVPAPRAHPSGLPVGLQLIAPPFAEAALLRAGEALLALDPA